ncbi:ScbA/BarX family gamma-butyrolactone biosynthesis protein [Streptomyces abikoensis]|uniref:ScbA/BarX family gamma-butyrolactone biosynthesis protein n=1 Tax=Streptomyces abikoensis TaxID=97398 RepID=UPI0033E2E026
MTRDVYAGNAIAEVLEVFMESKVPRIGLSGTETLEFTRTVDRSLLHRWALSEVFLTDARRVNESTYLAAAQLPPSHIYYTEGCSRLGVPDPLLLLECCRQAETYGGHAFFGVPRDSKFLLRSWSMSLPGLLTAPVTDRPGELAMRVRTTNRRGAAGDVRRLTYEVEMELSRHRLGTVRIDVGYIPGEVYAMVRERGRGRPLTPFADVPRTGSRLAPSLVGRTDPANVVLGDVRTGPDGASASLRVPVDNRSMFDHAQDHVPGMVLMEAARQLCLFTASELHGASTPRTTVAGFDFSFTRYAELDSPTTVHVRKSEPYGHVDELGAALPEPRTFHVEFEQDGEVIASGRTHTTTSRAYAAAGREVPA